MAREKYDGGDIRLGPDPFAWNVEQVIFALCNPKSPVRLSEDALLLPDAEQLASILREQRINGIALLSIPDQGTLRDDLGIKAYGHRMNLMHIVEKLQLASPQSTEKTARQVSSRGTLVNLEALARLATPFSQSPYQDQTALPPIIHPRSVTPSRVFGSLPPTLEIPLDAPSSHRTDTRPTEEIIPDGTPLPQTSSETSIIDEHGQKRRRLVLGPEHLVQKPTQPILSTPNIPPEAENSDPLGKPEGHQVEASPASNEPSVETPAAQPVPDRETFAPESQHDLLQEEEMEASARKRVKPMLISAPGDDDVDIADDSTYANSMIHPPTPHSLSVSAITSKDGDIPGQRKKTERRADDVYIGRQAFPVDHIFYDDLPLEGEPDLSRGAKSPNFGFLSTRQYSKGQRRYVGARIKHFLRCELSDLSDEGHRRLGLIPYPDGIGKKNLPLSMTLFTSNSNGCKVSRTNRHKWFSSATKQTQAPDASGDGSNTFNVADPELAVDSANDVKWNALEKWKYVDNDQVLPLYGHSGSEGEYDLETWEEMEDEHGKLQRVKGPSRRRKLTQEEVDQVLGDALRSMRQAWKVKKRPKLERGDWHLWAKAKRDGNRSGQLDFLSQESYRLQIRLTKLQGEIAAEEWTNPKSLFRQAKLMEPTVYDLEANLYKREILGLSRAPPKLPKVTTEPPSGNIQSLTEPLKDGEEDIVKYDSADSFSSDGSLANFVVDDRTDNASVSMILDNDVLTLADAEDSIDEDTRDVQRQVPNVSKTSKHSSHGPSIETTQNSDPQSGDGSPVKSVLPKIESGALSQSMWSGEDSEAIFQRSRSKKPVFQKPTTRVPKIIILTSDSDISPPEPARHSIGYFKWVYALKWPYVLEGMDRELLLDWVIAHCPPKQRKKAITYLKRTSMMSCQRDVEAALHALLKDKVELPHLNKKESEAPMQVCAWFISWHNRTKATDDGFQGHLVSETLARSAEAFRDFYRTLSESLRHFEGIDNISQGQSPSKKSKKIVVLTSESSDRSSDPSDLSSSDQKHIFATESQQTLDKRGAAMRRYRENQARHHDREEEETRRRLQLSARMSSMVFQGQDSSTVIVNPGKSDEQDFIHLPPDFGNGAHLKAHQKEGLQFMWRELTGDHKDLQGCLLAHLMGLGKTIQVIALLVTLTHAVYTGSDNVRSQIPPQLHTRRILILCPPTLIENWYDEFIMWRPPSHHLGALRKVSAALSVQQRIEEIEAWSREEGVLILGFSIFRDIIEGRRSKESKDKTLANTDEQQIERARGILTEKASIVVADEAHEFKNPKAKLNVAISKIKSKSRIALTGSPLSNNLGEYFSLINWIAPGYLGTYSEFKLTYEHPIDRGLEKDSPPALKREGKKRQKALELELEPKTHRADHSALDSSLHGKKEFLIKVSLTPIQNALYCDCVKSMKSEAHSARTGQVTLWNFLWTLQLLCSHPSLYYDKLVNDTKKPGSASARKSTDSRGNVFITTKASTPSSSGEEIDDPEAPLPENMLDRALQAARKTFDAHGQHREALELSHKMQIVFRILELSEKAKDKVLIFSHRLMTLYYIERQLRNRHIAFKRIAGDVKTNARQAMAKEFNSGKTQICLISTRAGGQGLNFYSANRVVILDDTFNPMWEQQAIGRAYRFGQTKQVYVYRLKVAGTFEDAIEKQSLYKGQLASRVVDKRNLIPAGSKKADEYIFLPKQVSKNDLGDIQGKDKFVLDQLLKDPQQMNILAITPFETFDVEDDEVMSPEDLRAAQQIREEHNLRRQDPAKYNEWLSERQAQFMSQRPHEGMGPYNLLGSIPAPVHFDLNGSLRRAPADAFQVQQRFPAISFLSTAPPMSASSTSPLNDLQSRPAQQVSTATALSTNAKAQDINSVLEPIRALETRRRSASPDKGSEISRNEIPKRHAMAAVDTPTTTGLSNSHIQSSANLPAPNSRRSLELAVAALLGPSFDFSSTAPVPKGSWPPVTHLQLESSIRMALIRKPTSSKPRVGTELDTTVEKFMTVLRYTAQDSHDLRRLCNGTVDLIGRDDANPKDLLEIYYSNSRVAGEQPLVYNDLASKIQAKRAHTLSPSVGEPPMKKHKPASLPSPNFSSLLSDRESMLSGLIERERQQDKV